ncbi:reverse transcriptase from transposon X-element protein, putative, partial [Rhizoctonia solani AG-3 Rhs1AP]
MSKFFDPRECTKKVKLNQINAVAMERGGGLVDPRKPVQFTTRGRALMYTQLIHMEPPNMSTHVYTVPSFLANYRPATNPSTRRQVMKSENRKLAEEHWTSTNAGAKFESRFPGISPRHFLGHTRALTRSQATLLFRLTTGHVQLRQHLHRLQLVDSPGCEHCGREHESVSHFLLRCSRYANERHEHIATRGPDFLRLSFLLHAPGARTPLCDYIKATGRFSDLVR